MFNYAFCIIDKKLSKCENISPTKIIIWLCNLCQLWIVDSIWMLNDKHFQLFWDWIFTNFCVYHQRKYCKSSIKELEKIWLIFIYKLKEIHKIQYLCVVCVSLELFGYVLLTLDVDWWREKERGKIRFSLRL